ncbi:hypothetical protein EVAR_5574_1 [Eumeta japonica]|uniref:Uncharacterized protein n=1 Tax=Eumeta variegata TaxID=151549 RepID=A0A4C1U256_EUMVA|nr:hypothetical protein EVAR_5574_1 [Eumeta japonica]
MEWGSEVTPQATPERQDVRPPQPAFEEAPNQTPLNPLSPFVFMNSITFQYLKFILRTNVGATEHEGRKHCRCCDVSCSRGAYSEIYSISRPGAGASARVPSVSRVWGRSIVHCNRHRSDDGKNCNWRDLIDRFCRLTVVACGLWTTAVVLPEARSVCYNLT